jgi:hypothetical protein
MTSRDRKQRLSLWLVLLTTMALVPRCGGSQGGGGGSDPGTASDNPSLSGDGHWVGFESSVADPVPIPVTISDNISLANLHTGALLLDRGELPASLTKGAMMGASTGALTGASTGFATGTTGAETPTLSGGMTAAAGTTVGAATSTSPGSAR